MTLPERQDSAPLYQQVKDYIVEHILSGKWPQGHRVSSENELTGQLGLSRMTVHRALRELHAEGWLKRIQGAGSFVAEPKPQSALLEIRNIREEVIERGHTYGCHVLLLESVPAVVEVAAALEIAARSPVHHSILVHLENESAVQFEERFVNPAFAPDYAEQDFSTITPYEYLITQGPIEAAEHVIEAVSPLRPVQEALAVGSAEPCLQLTRRTWSKGLVVTRVQQIYPGSRYRLAGRQDYKAHPRGMP